jgi:predicted permease
MGFYHLLALSFFLLHLAWIGWVLLGWVWTRRRPVLRWLHIGSVVYGMLIEIFFWTCPLTYLEQWATRRAGAEPYRGDFLLHYLDALIYPDVPPLLITVVAVAVCGFILVVYVRRWRRRDDRGW